MSKTNVDKSSPTKEKDYKKFINFGKIYLFEPSLTCTDDNFIAEMKEDLNSKFSNSNKYIISEIFDTKQEKTVERPEKLVFTRLSNSNSHFFGTFSRISNNKDVLTDIVDNESNEKIDPNSIYFEHNTLFYIDFEKGGISFIKTNHIKNVYPFLESFLNNNNFLNLKIAPLIKSEEEITKTTIISLEASFANIGRSPTTEFVELNKLEQMGCKIKDYKISLSFNEVNTSFPINLLSFRSKNKENIKKISISTLNEDIDLLTNTFTKSVPIRLSNNYEKDYTVIENTLKSELLKAIQ